LDLWKPWRLLLPGTLRTDSTHPSPHINTDGLILEPKGAYNPRVFIQELKATGIPFDIVPKGAYNPRVSIEELEAAGYFNIKPNEHSGCGITRINEEYHPNHTATYQYISLNDGSVLHVPLFEWIDKSG
jgi:hypothetical protein